MLSLTRRRLIFSGVSLLTYSAGCLDIISHETLNLQLVNWRDSEHQITISSPDAGFEESFTVSEDSSLIVEEFLEPANYKLKISVDTGESVDFSLNIGDCENHLLTVRLERPQRLNVNDDGCYPESEQ